MNRVNTMLAISFLGIFLTGFSFANDKLVGLLKTIDYTGADLAAIDSLSIEETEWLLYSADVKEAFRFSGPRLVMLIGKGIQSNQAELSDETLVNYIKRTLEIAKMARDEPFWDGILIALRNEFDHPLINEYLEFDNSERIDAAGDPKVIEHGDSDTDPFGGGEDDLSIKEPSFVFPSGVQVKGGGGGIQKKLSEDVGVGESMDWDELEGGSESIVFSILAIAIVSGIIFIVIVSRSRN